MADTSKLDVTVKIFTWQVVAIIGMVIAACTTLMILKLISVSWLERGLELLLVGAGTYVVGLVKQSPIDKMAQRAYSQGKKDSMRPPPLDPPAFEPKDNALPPITQIQLKKDDL